MKLFISMFALSLFATTAWATNIHRISDGPGLRDRASPAETQWRDKVRSQELNLRDRV